MKNDNPLLNKPLPLETTTVSGLEVFSNPHHLRRDIHTFVAYIREREIKRAHRSNQLPKADAKRLAKLMSHPECLADIEKEGYSWWIDEVDTLALKLGFVSYDTEGEYMGYSSHSPSFPDNYIEFKQKAYENFLALPLVEQETLLLKTMMTDKKYNEFYNSHLLSRLKSFSIWGSATGVMPHLKFPETRRFLLGLLTKLEAGTWYSTTSFIQYLKQNYPWFLIPEASKLPKESGGWNQPPRAMKRYGNFYESQQGREYYREGDPVPDEAADGFERVEGRFLERFLEGIPLTLGYVDVAYSKKKYQGLMPERGIVEAFRVNGRFLQLMREENLTSKVTVLPTFEIHVESPVYDAGLMNQLQRFATLITDDKVAILKLDKQLVKAALAADTSLEPVTFLQRLASQPLPQNIVMELQEWAGQADAFTLYEGFGLLEGDKRLPETTAYVVETITPTLRIVRRPDSVFSALEKAERIPLTIHHNDKQFTELPLKARTIFPKAKAVAAKPKRKTKERITIQQETRQILTAPTAVFYDQLRAELLKQRCIFEPDQTNLTIAYSQTYKPQVEAALQALRETYIIKFEDKTL